MADADIRTLQQIRRETEQTRAGLTNTVEQLKTSVADTAKDIRHRISPDAIKAEVSDYIRSRGEQLVNDVIVGCSPQSNASRGGRGKHSLSAA